VFRGDSLFAMASLILLILGLVLRINSPMQSISINLSKHTAYALSLQTPCYGIAALFCLFAFLYSIGYIPFNKTITQWHFWLSVTSIALFILGFIGLGTLGQKVLIQGIPQKVVLLSFLTSLPIFLFGQAFFAIGLTRSLLKMR
jgi:hypothetical protein